MASCAAAGGAPPAREVVTARVSQTTTRRTRNLRAALDAEAATFPGFVGVEVFSRPRGSN